MKAKIISQMIYEGPMDYIHNGGHTIKRLVISEADNLVITVDGENIYALTGFDFNNGHIIGEVEVPNNLIEKALSFVRAQKSFTDLRGSFESLLI